jgi:hypothetical protein
VEIIKKDILTVETGVICQSVNAMGPMGGLAGAIKAKWPIVESEYLTYLKSVAELSYPKFDLLGKIQVIPVTHTLSVANIFGQWHISTAERQTDYMAIHKGLEALRYDFQFKDIDVYFPYRFASDKGGAKWEYILEIIEYHFPDATICKLPK